MDPEQDLGSSEGSLRGWEKQVLQFCSSRSSRSPSFPLCVYIVRKKEMYIQGGGARFLLYRATHEQGTTGCRGGV